MAFTEQSKEKQDGAKIKGAVIKIENGERKVKARTKIKLQNRKNKGDKIEGKSLSDMKKALIGTLLFVFCLFGLFICFSFLIQFI